MGLAYLDKAALCRQIVNLIEMSKLPWRFSSDKNFAYAALADSRYQIFLSRINRERNLDPRYRSTLYVLRVFEANKEAAHFEDSKVDTFAIPHVPETREMTVVDVYDMAATGKLRPVPLRHVCGLSGFSTSLDDSCPACNAKRRTRLEMDSR